MHRALEKVSQVVDPKEETTYNDGVWRFPVQGEIV